MKKVALFLSLMLLFSCKQAKKENTSIINKERKEKLELIDKVYVSEIKEETVNKHLSILASDEMEGRASGTSGIEKAAKYIENEFQKIGLTTYKNLEGYRQRFLFEDYKSNNDVQANNIIGVLEGKSKKDEFVVISAYYDHLGMKKDGEGDRIYNGADDDASGVTAVITLAEYFKHKGTERTIIFIAFDAEEIGLLGSKHFVKDIDPSKFVAGINIEMIGKESKFGPKTAWLTGFDRSDLGKILQKNLKGTGYSLYPDPYTKFNLFFRADNAPLARLGIPSHTFCTDKIDKDPHYHKVSDEIETLNISATTETVKAIAQGIKNIVEAKDTPTRVDLK